MDERGGSEANAGLNDFKKALEEMQAGSHEKEEMKKTNKVSGGAVNSASVPPSGEGMGMGEGGILDLNLIKTDPDKLYPLIYYALKVSYLREGSVNVPQELTFFFTTSARSKIGSKPWRNVLVSAFFCLCSFGPPY